MTTYCRECGALVNVVQQSENVFVYELVDKLLIAKSQNIPFFCTLCGAIKFPIRAVRDIVFLLPSPYPETYKEGGQIEIPSEYREHHQSAFGIILSVGPGYWDKKRFHPTHDLKVGMKVVYDKTTPWPFDILGSDMKKHCVRCMGFRDVKAIVE